MYGYFKKVHKSVVASICFTLLLNGRPVLQSNRFSPTCCNMAHRLLCLSIALFFCALPLFAQNPALYFPPKTGTAWQTIAPASLGFCAERVDSLYHFLAAKNTKSFLLLQDGKIVLEKYFGTYVQDSVWYWASAGKSLTAFLVGQAQEEGLVDIDDATSTYLGPGWTSCTPEQENAITLRHQLTMTTGLDDTPTPASPDANLCTDPACLQYLAPPGTRWAYHTGPYRLLQNVVAEASGLTINQFTKTRVLDRVGMKGFWFQDVQYGRARDMARYGLLIQAHGVWQGDTLLHDQQYFFDMTHPSQVLNKSYGYLWWLNGQPSFMLPSVQLVIPGKLIPNAPDDMFSALGKNDQKIHVVPSKGWVVVRQGNSAGYTNGAGNEVPISFDNDLWDYLNKLTCAATTTQEVTDNQVRVFPNPTTNGWQIASKVAMERMEIFNTQGRLTASLSLNGATSFWVNAAELPEGVYLAKIFAAGKVRWAKLMKR